MLIKIIYTIFLGTIGIINLFLPSNETVRDIDGNVYNIVTIGDQIWMLENLKTTRLNDGENIPLIGEDYEWETLSSPGISWYNNENSTKEKYGVLYNWYAIDTDKICPNGWRVPTYTDWSVLINNLGGIDVPGTTIMMNGELKSTATEPDDHPRWDNPNTNATNVSGFSALPGGHRNYMGHFNYLGKFGFWWTATESMYSEYAYYWGMRYDNENVFITDGNINNGFSVRCIKS